MREISKKNYVFFAAMCFGTLACYAMFFNSIGSNATVMMDFYSISEASQGLIMTLLSVGGIGVSLFLAFFGERFNKIKVIGIGVLVICVSALIIGLIPQMGAASKKFYVLLLLSMSAGVGCNMVDVMINGTIKEVFDPKISGTVLSMAHASYGAMTMISPLIVTAVVNPELSETFVKPFFLLGIIALAVTVGFSLSGKVIMPKTPYADMTDMKNRASENPAEVFKDKRAFVYMAASMLYFGFQVGVAMWLPAYFQKEAGFEYAAAGRMLTVFFGGALVMRLVFPFILKKFSARNYFIITSVLSGGAFWARCF